MATEYIEAQGVSIQIETGSPGTFTHISQITNFSGLGGAGAEIDVTTLDSTAREYAMGLADNGEFSFDLVLDPDDPGQAALRTARDDRTQHNIEIELTDSTPTTIGFLASVREFSITGGVDEVLRGTVTLRVSGAVTWS